VSAHKSPLEAVSSLFGVSESAIRTLEAATSLFGDPGARQMLDQVSQARLRSQGALALAPLPQL
jgi:hypothetical protein